MTSARFSEQNPPPSLAGDVEVVRITRSPKTEPFQVKTCPHGTPGLVYQRGEGALPLVSIQTRSKKTQAVPELFLHGQGLEPSIMSFSGESSVIVQVVLKPHALYSIFGIPGVNLVLGHRPTEEFQGSGLLSSLRAGETDRDLFDAVYRFLEERRAASGLRDPKVEEALSFLFLDPCSFTPETIAAKLHLSPRQLQRRFLKVVGCPLKSFLRLRRANLALALLQSEEYDQLSDIAYALNYADQSHFIRDMKEFTWVAPSQLAGAFEDHSREGIGFSYL